MKFKLKRKKHSAWAEYSFSSHVHARLEYDGEEYSLYCWDSEHGSQYGSSNTTWGVEKWLYCPRPMVGEYTHNSVYEDGYDVYLGYTYKTVFSNWKPRHGNRPDMFRVYSNEEILNFLKEFLMEQIEISNLKHEKNRLCFRNKWSKWQPPSIPESLRNEEEINKNIIRKNRLREMGIW